MLLAYQATQKRLWLFLSAALALAAPVPVGVILGLYTGKLNEYSDYLLYYAPALPLAWGCLIYGVFQYRCPACRCRLVLSGVNPVLQTPSQCPKCRQSFTAS